MDDQADELFGPISDTPFETVTIEAPAPEPAPEPTPEPAAPEPPRDDQGRFVPLDALQEERRKRQDLERRLDEVEGRVVARTQQQAPTIPDPFDDPAGYTAFQDQQIQQRLDEQRFQISDVVAKQQYGEEVVAEAAQWAVEKAKADPSFAASYRREPHPIDWIVRQHKRDGFLAQIGDVSSVDDWFTREAAKRGYQPTATNAVVPAPVVAISPQQASPPVKVPRSLATQGSAKSDIRDVATGPLAGVDAVFP